jgi:hypothetical protein
MAASVRIEDEAFSDRRYDRLARECGLADADHARGKMSVLWRQCTLEHRHVLPVEDVEAVLGASAINALIAARLGERHPQGIRIRGTKGRIEWLKKLRDNGRFGHLGGRPKKTHKGSKNNPQGYQSETPPAPAPAPAPAKKEEEEKTPEAASRRVGVNSDLKPEPAIAFPPTLDTPEFRKAWAEWHEYLRAAKLRAWPAITIEKKLATLADMGPLAAIAAINHSIENRCNSIYPPSVPQNRRSPKADPKPASNEDIAAEIKRKQEALKRIVNLNG